jgi:hypothetical protein
MDLSEPPRSPFPSDDDGDSAGFRAQKFTSEIEISYESLARDHNYDIKRQINVYSPLHTNLLISSVQQSILQQSKHVSACHDYPVDGNVYCTSFLQVLLFFRKVVADPCITSY